MHRSRATPSRVTRPAVCLALLGLFVLQGTAGARAFEVRLLEGNEQTGTWGTDEFRITVQASGLMRHVQVRGREIVDRLAALYTFPIPPGEAKGLRTVQGEGYGDRGLSMAAPTVTTRDEAGTRVFEFRHVVGNGKVLGGRALCNVVQRVAIAPTGEIHLTYDCEWLETLRWQSFQLLTFFDPVHCEDREFLLAADDLLRTGTLDPGPRSGDVRQVRGALFEQLTVRAEAGPVHFLWPEKSSDSFYWGKDIQLRSEPRDFPRREPVLKGRKARIAFRVLLPVSQQ